jgi:hypothetical protein
MEKVINITSNTDKEEEESKIDRRQNAFWVADRCNWFWRQ